MMKNNLFDDNDVNENKDGNNVIKFSIVNNYNRDSGNIQIW